MLPVSHEGHRKRLDNSSTANIPGGAILLIAQTRIADIARGSKVSPSVPRRDSISTDEQAAVADGRKRRPRLDGARINRRSAWKKSSCSPNTTVDVELRGTEDTEGKLPKSEREACKVVAPVAVHEFWRYRNGTFASDRTPYCCSVAPLIQILPLATPRAHTCGASLDFRGAHMESLVPPWYSTLEVHRGPDRLKALPLGRTRGRTFVCLLTTSVAAYFLSVLIFALSAGAWLGLIILIFPVICAAVLLVYWEGWMIPTLEIIGDKFRLSSVFVWSSLPSMEIDEGGKAWRRFTEAPVLVGDWWLPKGLHRYKIKLSDEFRSYSFGLRMVKREAEWLLNNINEVIPHVESNGDSHPL